MKVCGISGSPIKNGNVDLLVSQVLKGASSQGVETQKLYLNDMHIGTCQSCGIDPYPKYCLFEDDMDLIYTAMEICDVIVLGSPVYFDTVSAQTKLAIDRCNCLMPYVKRPNGTFVFERRVEKVKKGVLIAVGGTDQDFNAIQTTIEGFFNWANVDLVERILYAHDDNESGGVKNDKRKMTQAFEVVIKIVNNTTFREEAF